MSKPKGNDKRSVIESQSIDLNEGIETRPSEIRSSKIVDREQINSSVNRERSQLPITSTKRKKVKHRPTIKSLNLREANTICDNNHMTLIRGGENIYDCFTCDKTFEVKE